MKDKIKIKETIIVEGKYDKIKLSSIFDTLIIETTGFSIYKDKEKQKLIRKCAKETGIIVLTDSDRAGFMLRGFLNGNIPKDKIKHAYIPQIPGKEKRKEAPSKDGFLGVEGVEEKILVEAIKKAAPVVYNEKKQPVTKTDFYTDGLSGKEDSSKKRDIIKDKLGLPKNLSASALLQTINQLMTYGEYKELINEIKEL
ncbi:MAG: DUF4093 domain-containing protein [Clostridia bacterium]|nr:DUF4093 domain-containing protein [Clostridia bacterium]